MPEKNKKIISVSDINAWLYCPRKLYLQRVCGLNVSLNRNMLIGKIKHSIIESFSKKEENFVSQLDKDYDKLDLVFMYEDFLKGIANLVFIDNNEAINRFMVDKEDIFKKILRDFSEDIKIRITGIKEATSKGFFKESIWKNLDYVYLSEVRLESPAYGLRGRVDRILISRKDNSIIPFELKSREDRIFRSDELQLTAYAMLLEDYYKTSISRGIVEVGNNKKEINITEQDKNEVLKIAEEIRNLSSENSIVPPIQSNFNKCRSCEFKEECMKL